MRFILGIIVGVLVTIWAAYLHDSLAVGPSPSGAAHRVVNWEVVQNDLHDLGAKLGAEWSRLTGHEKT